MAAIPSLPFEEYLKMPGLNSSLLKLADSRTPAHAHAAYLDPDAPPPGDSSALIVGSAVHCLLLEPDQWEERFAFPPPDAPKRPTAAQRNAAKPSVATTEAIAYWDAFDAAAAGKMHLSMTDLAAVHQLHQAVRNHPVLGPWFAEPGVLNELTITWDDQSGAACKARLDAVRILPDHVRILDLKSTQDASPREFGRSVLRYGYLLQGAFYGDGAAACRSSIAELQGLPADALDGMPIVFEFVAMEKGYPWMVARYEMTAEQIEHGRERYQRALQAVHTAEATGYWPGYDTAAVPLELPAWFRG